MLATTFKIFKSITFKTYYLFEKCSLSLQVLKIKDCLAINENQTFGLISSVYSKLSFTQIKTIIIL